MTTPQLLYRILEALPLSTFLVYKSIFESTTDQSWFNIYASCAIISTLCTWYLIRKKIPVNAIYMGISIYFISGYLSLLAGTSWLMEWYRFSLASGMLMWITAVIFFDLCRIYFTYSSEKNPYQRKRLMGTLLFFIASLFALRLSYHFKGDHILSEIIPFMSLFVIHRVTHKQTQ